MTSLEIITLVYSGVFIVLGAALLLRGGYMGKMVMKMTDEPSEIFTFGILTTILGLIVLGTAGFQIVWTGTLWVLPLLGWITFLKGIILTLVPDIAKPLYRPFAKSSGFLMFGGLVFLAIGIWLFYLG